MVMDPSLQASGVHHSVFPPTFLLPFHWALTCSSNGICLLSSVPWAGGSGRAESEPATYSGDIVRQGRARIGVQPQKSQRGPEVTFSCLMLSSLC